MTISNPKYSHKDVGLTEPKQTNYTTKQFMKDSTKVNIIACLVTLLSILLMVLAYSGCTQKVKPIDNTPKIDSSDYMKVNIILKPTLANYWVVVKRASNNRYLINHAIDSLTNMQFKIRLGDSIYLSTFFNQSDMKIGQQLKVDVLMNDTTSLFSYTANSSYSIVKTITIR
jgi:hypothetical protein